MSGLQATRLPEVYAALEDDDLMLIGRRHNPPSRHHSKLLDEAISRAHFEKKFMDTLYTFKKLTPELTLKLTCMLKSYDPKMSEFETQLFIQTRATRAGFSYISKRIEDSKKYVKRRLKEEDGEEP
jgi:hypothetical protein